MQNQYKASAALAVSVLGSIATMPWGFGSGFWGGLCHHGFLAATIGGLADWFAVTALFHKPLGISYRTDILRRNRKRIMDEIVVFASDDLLSVENIMKVLDKQDTAQMLVEYISMRGGRERLCKAVEEILLTAAENVDTAAWAKELEKIAKQRMGEVSLETVFPHVLETLASEKYSKVLARVFLEMAREFCFSASMQELWLQCIASLRKEYESNSMGREFILDALDISNERILAVVNERISAKLDTADKEGADFFAWWCRREATKLLSGLASDVSALGKIDVWKEQFLSSVDLATLFAQVLEKHFKGQNPVWLEPLHCFLNRKLDAFMVTDEWKHRVDRWIKRFFRDQLEQHHQVIAEQVQGQLNKYTDDEISELVESKVADDLQMIRINGALVGSLVGMALYLVVNGVERLWGI
mgnify:CR=1 FL=1